MAQIDPPAICENPRDHSLLRGGECEAVNSGDRWLVGSVSLTTDFTDDTDMPRTFNRPGPDTAAGLASSSPNSPEPRTIVAALATSSLDAANAEPTALPAVACSSLANFWSKKNIGQFVEVADSISANASAQPRRTEEC